MAVTPNYSWVTPAPTDLVTDLPADFETFADAVDATVFTNAGAAIAKTIVDAKGDIIAATAADTVARLAVGANDTVLTADSATATGLKWASIASPAQAFTLLNTGGTALTGATTITVSGISAKNQLRIIAVGGSAGSAAYIQLRLNGDTGTNYLYSLSFQFGSSQQQLNSATGSEIQICRQGNDGAYLFAAGAQVDGANSTGPKMVQVFGGSEGGAPQLGGGYAAYLGTSTISSISLVSTVSNFDAGTLYVYGA
jgi:hypothetical protein